MLLLFVHLAVANSPLPETQRDFLIPPRTDAPTDGVLLFEANFTLQAEVTEGPGAPFPLETEVLLADVWGAGFAVTFANPSGWEAGAAYVVAVATQDSDGVGTPASLAFTVGSAPAAAPSAPIVTDVQVGEWVEGQEHVWGCCDPTRKLTFEVTSASDDPWAYVELMGLFEGDTQITEGPVLQRLAVGVGPGAHTLTYTQWKQDGALQPGAFEIVGVSASGARSEPQRIDVADDTTSDDGGAPALCGTPGALGLVPIVLAAGMVRRRRPG